MDKHLVLLFQTIPTIRSLHEEFQKPKNFWKIISKFKYKKFKNSIKQSIQNLENDYWTSEYLYELNKLIYTYYDYLYMYMSVVSVPDFNTTLPVNTSIFHKMYFLDQTESRDVTIHLDCLQDSISFVIFDNKTGSSFGISSNKNIQLSQKKLESICKQKIIDLLMKSIDGTSKDKNSSPINRYEV